MLTAEALMNLGKASAHDRETIAWVLSRMQIELGSYMLQSCGEPGPPETHQLAARKVQVYINSPLREVQPIHS